MHQGEDNLAAINNVLNFGELTEYDWIRLFESPG